MPSTYPGTLDNLVNVNPGDLIESSFENLQSSCVNAVEATLGTNPQGSYATVGAAVAGKLDMAAGGTMAADIAMGGHGVTGLADPASAQDAATKNYVDNLAQGMSWHNSARAASTGNISGATYNSTGGSSGHGQFTTMPSVLDSVPLTANDRVLVKDQSTASQNGIYAVSTVGTGADGVWDRAADFDDQNDAVAGVALWVTEGTVNADSGWLLTTPVGYVIGGASGSDLNFTQFSGAGQITAGAGLTKTGNTISLSSPVGLANGGTGAATASAAFDALSPLTSPGDVLYGGASGTGTRLAGNATATKEFLTSTGTGSAAQAPSWDTLSASDIPSLDHTKISDFDTQVRTSRLDQMAVPTGDVSLNGQKITSLASPSSSGDAATKGYVDTQVSGANPMTAVGDTIYGGTSGVETRLGSGVN